MATIGRKDKDTPVDRTKVYLGVMKTGKKVHRIMSIGEATEGQLGYSYAWCLGRRPVMWRWVGVADAKDHVTCELCSGEHKPFTSADQDIPGGHATRNAPVVSVSEHSEDSNG